MRSSTWTNSVKRVHDDYIRLRKSQLKQINRHKLLHAMHACCMHACSSKFLKSVTSINEMSISSLYNRLVQVNISFH